MMVALWCGGAIGQRFIDKVQDVGDRLCGAVVAVSGGVQIELARELELPHQPLSGLHCFHIPKPEPETLNPEP